MTFLPLFPLSLGGFDFLHASGAAGAVFSPVGFGDKGRAADGAPFPAPPVQEGCGQLPVKGQDSHTEPAAHEGKGNVWYTIPTGNYTVENKAKQSTVFVVSDSNSDDVSECLKLASDGEKTRLTVKNGYHIELSMYAQVLLIPEQ